MAIEIIIGAFLSLLIAIINSSNTLMELYDDNPDKKRYALGQAAKSGIITFIGFTCLAIAVIIALPYVSQ